MAPRYIALPLAPSVRPGEINARNVPRLPPVVVRGSEAEEELSEDVEGGALCTRCMTFP